MFTQTIHSLLPLRFLLDGFNPADLLSGIDFFELIFAVLNQITFLVDIIVGGILVGAIIRGIFKNFWKVLWRGIIFLVLLLVVVLLAGPIGTALGKLPIGLKGDVDGVTVAYATLNELIHNVVLHSGQSEAYALAFTEVVLKNLAIFIAVPFTGILTSILSAVTFPIIKLAIPKKIRDIKLIPVKLAISIAFSLIGVMVFAIPMATLVPPMTAIKETIADDTLLKKFLNPEFIGFLELFTSEKSAFLKIISLGNSTSSLNIYNKFTVDGTVINLKDALPALFEELNNITYTVTPSPAP